MDLILQIVGIVAWILVGIFVTKIFCKWSETNIEADEVTDVDYVWVILGIIFWPIIAISMLLILAVYGLGCGFIRIAQWIVK